jgi:tetratricopeptide (TPR) repeat protein
MSAKSLIRLGQYDQAAAFLEEAQAATELERLHILGALALAYWYKGLAQKALETIRQVDISVGEASPNFATLSANVNVAETYLLAWQAAQQDSTGDDGADSTHPADAPNPTDPALLPEIKAGARQACKTLHNFSRVFPIGKPAAWLYQGNLDWLEGKADNAYKAWRKAISLAEQLAMPYELARAHYELGRFLPLDDPQREKHLQAAAAGFERLGAAGDLRRTLEETRI